MNNDGVIDKELSRFLRLKQTAELTCRYLEKSSGNTEVFFINENALKSVVHMYFERVQEFKEKHLFGPEKLINRPKQATLLFQAIYARPPIQVRENAPDTIHVSLANEIYALRAVMNVLRVPLEDVPEALQDDLMFALRHTGHDDELGTKLLILIMHLLEEAYGEKSEDICVEKTNFLSRFFGCCK